MDPITEPNGLTLVPGPAALVRDKPISPQLYIGYGIGMIGERVFRDTPALLLLVFMTNYLAIPAAMAGTAIFLPKILVVFVDPLVGIISDRIRSPWGRRRPLMFAGAILSAASFLLFFNVPTIDNVWWRTAYMALMITLGFAAYALFSVPYLSMASEMSTKSAEHTRLMAFRVGFMAAGLSIGGYSGAVVQYGGGGFAGYRLLAVAFGMVCLVTMMVTVFATGSARQCDPDGAPMGLFDQFRMARANERYMLLLLVNLLQKIGEGIGYGSFAYFVVYYVHQPISVLGSIIVGTLTGQVLSQPFWVWVNGRINRSVVYSIGVLGFVVSLLVWLTLIDAPLWQLVLMGVWTGIMAGGFLSVMLMMLADSISSDAEKKGIKREGTYSGIWLATEKVGAAAGAFLVGQVLGLFHFVSSSAGMDAAQPKEAVIGIALVYVALNGLIYTASILPVWRYQTLVARG
jgi:GPH family glycoside/pentoside/hexuronide:cation symporter